jgi:hypothetical protein
MCLVASHVVQLFGLLCVRVRVVWFLRLCFQRVFVEVALC